MATTTASTSGSWITASGVAAARRNPCSDAARRADSSELVATATSSTPRIRRKPGMCCAFAIEPAPMNPTPTLADRPATLLLTCSIVGE